MDKLHNKTFYENVSYLFPLVLFQCTGIGAHGACGASAPSSVDLARENACASVTTRRPSMEGRVAWAQTGRLCRAVCLIVLVSSQM